MTEKAEKRDATEFEPWVEKYRPRKLKDIIGHDAITERLQSYVDTKMLPHLLFAGPPGTGKTACALALAHELFGDAFQQSFLELNASVAPETPVLVRQAGVMKRTTFGELATVSFESEDKYAYPTDLEVLSLDSQYKVSFLPVRTFSRHRVSKLVRIRYEGGFIRTSADHSLIVFDEFGNLVSKPAEEVRGGDLLISFAQALPGREVNLPLSEFKPQEFNLLHGRSVRNPRVKNILEDQPLNRPSAWLLGLYLAEGCATLSPKETSGVTVFTVGSHEEDVAYQAGEVLEREFELSTFQKIGYSGFDRMRGSSIQVRALNTQLVKFLHSQFYDASGQHNARTKRVPSFVFEAPLEQRLAFLKGYAGDASGAWGRVLRYSSRSSNCLIDAAWLGRISGIETAHYPIETRLIWKNPDFSYVKQDLLPANLVFNALKEVDAPKFRYFRRHSLYAKRSPRVSKTTVQKFLEETRLENKPAVATLSKLLNSPLYSVQVTGVEAEPYNGYVYDFSVPGAERFWGGTTPILLHNSDERGIDVIRGKIKDFARTLALSDTPFKIIFLDEADALTDDAQQALRRTMERYSANTRFLLSCNYSSRIIEPIQSRCAVFRFARLSDEELAKVVGHAAKGEGLHLDDKALVALLYVAGGDARKAVNALQGASIAGRKVTEDDVFRVASRARPAEVEKMVNLALSGKFVAARDLLDELMVKYGMSGEDVIGQIFREITRLPVSERQKVELVDKVGEYEFRMVEGANERIQLEALLAQFMLAGSKKE